MSENNDPLTAPVYPKHGWILNGQDKAYIVLPFLGCISHRRMEWSKKCNGKDPQYHNFSSAYLELDARFVLWLKSLELWYDKSASFPYPAENLLLKDLYTDLCLYELSCLFDSLARVLAFVVSDTPKEVDTRNFYSFRKWVIETPGKVKTPWIIDPLKDKDLDHVKKPRNVRTHENSRYNSISNLANNAFAQTLSSVNRNGQRTKYNMIDEAEREIKILFRFLESITRNLEDGIYHQDDIPISYADKVPKEWTPGPWLDQLVPRLSSEAWNI